LGGALFLFTRPLFYSQAEIGPPEEDRVGRSAFLVHTPLLYSQAEIGPPEGTRMELGGELFLFTLPLFLFTGGDRTSRGR